VGRVENLVSLGEPRDRLAELLLLQGVETQAGLVQKEDRVLQIVLGLGMEDDKERDEPAKTLAPLIQLDGNAELVLDQGLEVLAIYIQTNGQPIVVPDSPNLLSEPRSRRLERPLSLSDAAFVGGQLLLVLILDVDIIVVVVPLLGSFGCHVGEFLGGESQELEQLQVPEVVVQVDFSRRFALGQPIEVNARADREVR